MPLYVAIVYPNKEGGIGRRKAGGTEGEMRQKMRQEKRGERSRGGRNREQGMERRASTLKC